MIPAVPRELHCIDCGHVFTPINDCQLCPCHDHDVHDDDPWVSDDDADEDDDDMYVTDDDDY
jgi:hypothetical protein